MFVKVHAPLDRVLYQKAEDMNIQMPVKNNHWSRGTMRKEINTTFSKANAASFNTKNGEYFFENVERSRMVRRILQMTSFTREETPQDEQKHEEDTNLENDHGIEQLCYHGIYDSYYPLHDGPLETRESHTRSRDDNVENDRKRLQEDWASLSKTFKYQPLDTIRNYFGVRVSFYFAWLGVYTAFLVPAALMGFLCFLYGLGTMTSSDILKEICDESNERFCFIFCFLFYR